MMQTPVSRLLRLCCALVLLVAQASCSSSHAASEQEYYYYPPFQEIVEELDFVKDPKQGEEKPNTIVKGFIVLDPGHGGDDLGTHSTKPFKYQEKVLTLSTAKMLKTYLEQLGYAVQMTRSDDMFVALDKRANFANTRRPQIFVSVHYNSAPSKSADGIEIFYYKSDAEKSRSAESKTLANAILKRMIENTEAKSRGVKHGNLAVIRETDMPAVLIEGGFLTNEEEMYKLKDANYLKKLAWGIAQGIEDYLSKK